ncbi:hypothetical protein [Cellulomonas sp. ATA003]|uniref:hypothetical protein n=1 Tax=Cellulomonas sp. ATA003 TaxID=3073064 RepID=UPI002872DBC7|nr:hypothetical protein [Cellulomonas sp. ATA003]WNB87117.1 hypothetical protein REH70_08365 [Cellulomonas sp. ATA003]
MPGDGGAPSGVSVVTCEMTWDVRGPTTFALQVAVATAGAARGAAGAGSARGGAAGAGAAAVGGLDEDLDVRCDGGDVEVSVVGAPAGGRQHVVRAPGVC